MLLIVVLFDEDEIGEGAGFVCDDCKEAESRFSQGEDFILGVC